jgi:hypothetical protein
MFLKSGVAVVFSTVLTAAALAADVRLGDALQTLEIRVGDLAIVMRDNSRSPRVLSGIDSLFNLRDAPGFDAFDPDGKSSSAGLNFEHIISGHRNSNNKFTPRSGPYSLYRMPGGQGALLVRRSADEPWNVSSTLEYKAVEQNAIDFTFRCRCHRAELFGARRYAIFFFANYMNDVADLALHFRGVSEPGGAEQWIAADAPNGFRDWNAGGTYRHRDAPPLEYDRDLDFRLNSWSYDWPRYTEPFYFGRATHDMTLVLMFDRAHTADDEIRFSLFKFKLPRYPRPAWDFQYVIHKVDSAKEYGFRGRLVWKKFKSAEDCREEYRKWLASNGHARQNRKRAPFSVP